MAGLNCSNCSAALQITGDEKHVRCSYCGTDNRVAGGRRKSRGDGPPRPPVILALVFLILLLGGATLGLWALKPAPHPPSVPATPIWHPPAVVKELTEAAAMKAAGVSPSELGTIAGRGWVPVSAPEIDGTFAAFDPLKNLPWAVSMAQAWSTDARVQSIYIDGVRADGGLDISARDDWDVDYRFYSPTLRDSARAMAKVSEETVDSELRLMVGESGVEALLSDLSSQRREDPPVYTPRCAFADVMTRARAQGLGERPTYDLMLTHQPRGWRWHVSGKDISSAVVQSASCPE